MRVLAIEPLLEKVREYPLIPVSIFALAGCESTLSIEVKRGRYALES